MNDIPENSGRPSEFESLASQERSIGIVREFWQFLKYNKKWWLAPILIVLLLFGALVFMTGTAAAPFIYPFF